MARALPAIKHKSKHLLKKARASAKPAAKTVGRHTWRASRYVGKKTAVATVVVAKKTHKVAKVTRYHVATRPHNLLMANVAWYNRWHSWDYHKYLHAGIFAIYTVVIASMMLSSYRITFASDLSSTWNFSTPGNYNISSGIETSGSLARLKAQNYTNDANTSALYHLDENSGTTLTDSSSNNNTATTQGSPSFGNGNLNNGLSLNGHGDSVSAPDSSSLSLSQKNSIEGWTKFNSNFSAGSSGHRQGIVDKGDYQLYYDNETGKVTYELADKNADTWSLAGGNDVNGGWDQNGKLSVNSMVKMGSDIYVGIGVTVGDAEVWKWDGTNWTQIGGGASPLNNSWDGNTYEGVYSLATDGTHIYAGLGITAGDAEVWSWDGNTWTKIGGDSINNGWTNYAEQIWTLDYFGGNLYAGIGSGANDAEVWKWDGSNWSKIGGDSVNSGWTTNYEIVGGLTNDGTNLYAGLGVTAGDSEVWKWNGSSWSKIGGDSVNSSWDTTIETVRSLRYFGGTLYAGLGDSAGDADVYSYNGSTWTKIGGDGLNSSWAASTYEQVSAFAYDGTNLYAGLGTSNGDGEVWKWNGSSWSKIGGDGQSNSWSTNQGDTVNTLLYDSGKLYSGTYDAAGDGLAYTWDGSSWTQIGGGYVNKSWGFYGVSAVQVMQASGEYLYAGLGNTAGSALVFRFDGSSWTLVGGQGVNNSWAPNTYEQVMSMASYNGHLFVGLGTTQSGSTADGEVWEYDGSTWTQVGGDGINSSWLQTSHFGEVDSMASYNGKLYAGLGSSSSDGEVWEYDGTNWTKIGGDSINGGWTNYAENIYSLAIYEGKLVAGLGRSAGDAEVWEWNGSTWNKIGGDNLNSGWDAVTYEDVESLMPYGGKLYAGLGASTGDAVLYEWDGSSWTKVGGDDVNGSWTTGTYEKLKTLSVYNGDLYAGLGNSTGDGEVWRLSGNSWTKVGGNSLKGGWTNAVEEVESFSPYKGKLYAGTGLTTNADGLVWSLGDNAYLTSNTSSFDTNWHHIAATYDGTTMKIYIDGVLDNSTTANVLLPDSTRALEIGTTYGGREYGKPRGYFDGMLDEIRISDIARTSFTTKSYTTTPQTISLGVAALNNGVKTLDTFAANESPNGGSITYRLSDDGGTTWKYWDGSQWSSSSGTSEANDKATIDAHISSFPVTYYGLRWQAVFSGDGTQQVTLNDLTVQATSDAVEPSANASNIQAYKTNGGTALASNDWTNGGSPYFTWDAGSDAGSGIYGYCLYLGQDNTADPVTTAGLLGTSPTYTGGHCQFLVTSTSVDLATAGYLGTALTTSTSPYYLNVKAIDKAGNVFSSSSAQFHFRFDNTPPTNPGYVTAPSGFINTKDVTFSWATSGGQAPSDGASGVAGLQYRVGSSGTWYGDNHSGSGDINDLLANDGSYQTTDPPDYTDITEGINNVYFRTWDQAGNVTTSYASAALKINTNGSPSEPQDLSVTPSTNTSNAFAFNWDPPATFVGDVGNLRYCYTVNVAPSASTCTFSSPGSTSLGSGPFATQPGSNTFYVVAKDESNNINYDSYASTTFTANTTAPGMPTNADIVDVSIKSTNNWRLALTWDAPTNPGAGVNSYKIYRSTNNASFTPIGASSSTTYIDAGLSQQTYYYKVKACDSTNNCSSDSSTVSMLPTGKFTNPANLTSDPQVSNVTTKRARIAWSTDRGSDSKVALGTSSGHYSPSEIGNSDQVTAHSIDLDNLAAGTTYYYQVKWTDEDGNTGSSQEYSFTTNPAPVLKNVTVVKVGLSNATIQFTVKGANKVNLYFGASEEFGGLKSVNTSTNESTYTVELTGLSDGTKYSYKLGTFDSEGTEYGGSIATFTTPARPHINNLRFQPITGEPTSTQKITWTTNVPSDSSITYGVVGTNGTDVQLSALTKEHAITIHGLQDDSEYFLIAQSRDKDGNLATSDRQTFRTALDTRPPKVSEINIETSIRGLGADARGQVIVSWKTDEPSSSQVAYGEGANATVFNSKTTEDTQLTTEHLVVVSDLGTSKVFSLQPVSRDKSGNAGLGEPQSAIIGHASDSVLTVILNTLQKIFGL